MPQSLRREPRRQVPATVRLMWLDAKGADKFAIALCHDVSESGMRIELPEPVETRSYVTLLCTKLKLQGTASVRSCLRQGSHYVVGLEFAGGLKWRPPSEL